MFIDVMQDRGPRSSGAQPGGLVYFQPKHRAPLERPILQLPSIYKHPAPPELSDSRPLTSDLRPLTSDL
jgi:hypothetical protein